MQIGFGVRTPGVDDTEADQVRLEALGCERLFLAADREDLETELDNAFRFLREGDVLVVSGLSRLGPNFTKVLEVLCRLGEIGVSLHSEREEIRPGTPVGDTFLQCCAMLSRIALQLSKPNDIDVPGREGRRGRPMALSPSNQIRAAELLQKGSSSVTEVARLLAVSPATIYRHFPQGKRSRKPL